MAQPLTGFFLGRQKYTPIFELMTELFEARRENRVGDLVLLLEHSPVITLGRGAHQDHILTGKHELEKIGVDVVSTGRGGDVTLHAPGQLIAYPIIDLKPDRCDVRKYVQNLTQVMNELIRPHKLDGGTIKELIGLWLDAAEPGRFPGEEQLQSPVKIGAIGVRISRWITTHGFALNLSTNMDLFRLIVPCGIKEHGVVSVEQLTGTIPDLEENAQLALRHLNARLGAKEPRWVDLHQSGADELSSRIYEYFS